MLSMSCVLTVVGENFDVDTFVAISGLSPHTVWYKGEPRNKRGELNQKNGFNLSVSDAEFNDFNNQVSDTLLFLSQNADKLQLLKTVEIEFATLDFGVDTANNNGMYKGFYLPPSLVEAAAAFGIGVKVTVYLSDED